MPKTRSEREIAGYRDVLNIIHENNEFIPITVVLVKQQFRYIVFMSINCCLFPVHDEVIFLHRAV